MSVRRTTLLDFLCVSAVFALAACGEDTTGTTPDTTTPNDADTLAEVSPETTPDTTTCPENQACDDGDGCTENDRCDAAGVCAGTARTCDDGVGCTADSCSEGACVNALTTGFCLEGTTCTSIGSTDPTNTCRQCAPASGGPTFITLSDTSPCNDGNACTVNDVCSAGVCIAGAARVCAATGPCIAASCEPATGCVETATTASCDDGNPCTVGDVCAAKSCTAGAAPLDCDDQDPCTVDSCVAGVGCFHDAFAKCNDNNACTNDSCQPDGTCVNTTFTGPCDDGDPCTLNEECNAQFVCGGGAPRSCDDENGCTTDACIPGQGCLNLFRNQDCASGVCGPALCDDGEACTIDDRCVAGECFGAKTASCPLCSLAATDKANKITSLLVMADGQPGSGLDIDDNPMTCAPSNNCGGGIDNELSVLASLVNPGITDSIEDGVVKWVIDLRRATRDGTEFPLSIYDSGLAFDNFCNYQGEVCDYDVAPLSFDANCDPYFLFDNARIDGNRLTAGGSGQLISMVLPLVGGSLLAVTIAEARTEATLTFNAQGDIIAMNGIIAGAIPKAQLIEAVRELDPDSFSLPGLTPAAAADLLDLLVTADIDLDGDGVAEAASVAMRIATIPARIVAQ
jgi:hypothetical protein